MNDKQRDVALFRYSLVREAADASLTKRQRGALVRELACSKHLGPDGSYVVVSRKSIDRWIRAYRRAGFEALAPTWPLGVPATPSEVLDLAVSLKREVPKRTGAQQAAAKWTDIALGGRRVAGCNSHVIGKRTGVLARGRVLPLNGDEVKVR